MVNLNLIEFSIGFIIGVLSVLLLTFWLTVITYRLKLTLKKHKYYLKEYFGDSRIRSQILYALETVRNKDIFLLILIILDISMFFCFTLVLPQLNINVYKSVYTESIRDEVFPKCNISLFIVYFYVYPANTFMIITFGMLIITQFMIISFLNSYLSGRYFGHSLPRKVIYKYIFWWVFQYIMQTIFIVPKLLIFLPLVCVVFLFFNWFNIILTSRKMCNAIRSKLEEIRLFEWNPNHYRIISRNFKHYKAAMSVFIFSFLLSVIALTIISILYFLHIVTGNCYLETVYGITAKVNLTQNATKQIQDIVDELLFAFAFALSSVNAILLLLPSLLMFLFYGVNLIYHCCTGKGNMNRINTELFEPLMSHKY